MTPAAPTRRGGLPWWGRLLVVVAFDGALVGLTLRRLQLSPALAIGPDNTLLAVAVGIVVGLTLILSGPARWPLRVHGVFLLLIGLAFFYGPGGIAAVYRTVALAPTTVTTGRVTGAGVEVQTGTGTTRTVYSTGHAAVPQGRTTVWLDPLHITDGQTTAPSLSGAPLAAALLGGIPVLLLQIEAVGVLVRRRDDSVLARWGTPTTTEPPA